ncbi:uncharacterized protein CCOS01_04468 [Colletotrichum costaricense]|uniref:Uncharacterized protein n=1 Tax=Colletotrichum costaricense TaxID=1209916 RepID=A0AAI9Z2G1_9PEZI|nr:uncharacterized protein CCOS01_04468 [Colletotrichum costaricense]KAK1532485.1 hypothetical protein CCOS01_04468 [Colletotrichum costaricense]
MAATRTYFSRYPHVWHDRSTRPRLTTMSLETIEESLGEVSETPPPDKVKKMLQSASRAEAITKALFEQVYAPNKPGEKGMEGEESQSPPTELATPGSKAPSTWNPTTPGCIDCTISPSPSHNHSNNIGWTSFEDVALEARTLAEYGIRSPRVKSRLSRFQYADYEQEPLTRNEPWIKRFSYFEYGIEAARGIQRRDDVVVVDPFHVNELPVEAEIEELVLPPPVLPLPQPQPPAVAPHLEELRPRSLDLSAAKVNESESGSEITSEEHLCLFCSSVVWSESKEDSEYSLADQEIRRELDAVSWDFEKWALGDGNSDTDGEESPASPAAVPASPATPAEQCGGVVAVVEMERREEEEEEEEEESAFSVVLLANLVGFSISFLTVSIVFGLRSESQ